MKKRVAFFNDKFNFILQDGITYLRSCKKKYDLIVVDVANNDGLDLRFLSDEYFKSKQATAAERTEGFLSFILEKTSKETFEREVGISGLEITFNNSAFVSSKQ